MIVRFVLRGCPGAEAVTDYNSPLGVRYDENSPRLISSLQGNPDYANLGIVEVDC